MLNVTCTHESFYWNQYFQSFETLSVATANRGVVFRLRYAAAQNQSAGTSFGCRSCG